jgi:hypothetical protein
VRAGDFLEREALHDVESGPASHERFIDRERRLRLLLGRKVVATEEVEPDVLEQ